MLFKGSEKWGLYMEITDIQDIVFTYHKITPPTQERKNWSVLILQTVHPRGNYLLYMQGEQSMNSCFLFPNK